MTRTSTVVVMVVASPNEFFHQTSTLFSIILIEEMSHAAGLFVVTVRMAIIFLSVSEKSYMICT